MLPSDVIKFQKTLALAAAASNEHEAAAAELAARRVMQACNLDPTRIPDGSFYSQHNFADSMLLAKLREEYRAAHPAPKKELKETPQLDLDYLKSPKLPFSINGYRRITQKGKPPRRSPSSRSHEDHELIRSMLNSGMSVKAVERKTGFTNVNSTRAYMKRNKKWIRDERGHWQWARK